MSLHSPACEDYLAQLRTAPNDSAEHRMADVVGRLDEPHARGFLLTVIDEDRGTHAADIATRIWHLAADTTEEQL